MIYAGTVLEISGDKTYVFTIDCEMTTIKTKDEYFVGKQISFVKKDKLKDKKGGKIFMSKNIKYISTIAAVLVVVLTVAFTHKLDIFNKGTKHIPIAVISIDINPSIEIEINNKDEVIKTKSFNDDAKNVLSKLDLEYLNTEKAIQQIIDTSKNLGYIENTQKPIFITSALKNVDNKKETIENINKLFNKLTSESKYNIISLVIDNSSILFSSQNNKISIGREIINRYASNIKQDISANDIKNMDILELLNKLELIDEKGNLKKEILQEVINKEIIITTKNTDLTSNKITTKKEEIKKEFKPELNISTRSNSIIFKWTPIENTSIKYKDVSYENFKYYKIVASESVENPKYPDNGYIHFVDNHKTSEWTFNPFIDEYNKEPELNTNNSYFFSITYVFENGSFTSNSSKLKIEKSALEINTISEDEKSKSEQEEKYPILDPSISSNINGNTISFNWAKAMNNNVRNSNVNYTNFKYYKIVASETNSSPSYPNDGYVYYTSDINSTSWDLNPHEDNYNKSPQLIPGKTYYFAITYVFDNGSISSNSITMMIPKTQSQTQATQTQPTKNEPTFSPSISVSSDDKNLYFSWNSTNGSTSYFNGVKYTDFKYYKIVASESNPNPQYPEDGYLSYFEDINTTSWRVSTNDSYNKSPELVAGKTYYLSVTYVFSNGKVSSNSVKYTMPGVQITQPPVTNDTNDLKLSVNVDNQNINFAWTPISENQANGFNYYKVVVSTNNSSPKYPEDGYLSYFTSYDTSTWSLNHMTDDYNKSPKLVSGQTYYCSITYVYNDRKEYGETVTFQAP